MLFGQGEVLDRPGELAAAELQEFVDPDPSHCAEHPPRVDREGPDSPQPSSTTRRADRPAGRRLRPAATRLARAPAITRPSRGRRLTPSNRSSRQLALDILNEHVDRVKVADLVDGGIVLESSRGRRTADGPSAPRRPWCVSLPSATHSGSAIRFSGNSSPRGILIPKFRSRRKTMSRKSIDSAPRSPWSVALAGHVFLVHAQGIHQGGLDFLEDFIVCRHSILRIRGECTNPTRRHRARDPKDERSGSSYSVGSSGPRTSDGRSRGASGARMARRNRDPGNRGSEFVPYHEQNTESLQHQQPARAGRSGDGGRPMAAAEYRGGPIRGGREEDGIAPAAMPGGSENDRRQKFKIENRRIAKSVRLGLRLFSIFNFRS